MLAVGFAAQAQFPATFELSSLDGTNGFVLNGIDDTDRSGFSVSGAGDVNGDGFDDVIIGAYGADPNGNSSGESYVVFGRSGGFSPSFELSSLDGTNGFVLNGVDELDSSGIAVSGAGDVNGDGFNDLIIGASQANPNGNLSAGASYVVFGKGGGFSATLELSSLDGTNGFVLYGVDELDWSGRSVSGAGDVNGDGFNDVIIGASFADPNGDSSGESYVVFGKSGGYDPSFELGSLDGTNGFVLNGIDEVDRSGVYVSGAGDINGDGLDDVIIAASRADPNGKLSAGESYVVFGKSGGYGPSFELGSLDGTNGYVLNGIDAGDLNLPVSDAGDVNGDGVDDVIIGALLADPNGESSGESYVVFGKNSGFSPSFELSSLDGTNGFVLNGIDPSNAIGRTVSGAGDVNGDGFDDVIIGADGVVLVDPSGKSSGKSYVVFGKSGGFGSPFELNSLDGMNGFVLNGVDVNDGSGFSVSGAGDVNGDGLDDLLIGALFADPNGIFSGSGESYVVFGRRAVPEPGAASLAFAGLTCWLTSRRSNRRGHR